MPWPVELPALTRKIYTANLAKALDLIGDLPDFASNAKALVKKVYDDTGLQPALTVDPQYQACELRLLQDILPAATQGQLKRIQEFTVKSAWHETDKATYQAMEALVHNLNSMHSRAGAQTPFSSLNYGMDTSEEGRMLSATS